MNVAQGLQFCIVKTTIALALKPYPLSLHNKLWNQLNLTMPIINIMNDLEQISQEKSKFRYIMPSKKQNWIQSKKVHWFGY